MEIKVTNVYQLALELSEQMAIISNSGSSFYKIMFKSYKSPNKRESAKMLLVISPMQYAAIDNLSESLPLFGASVRLRDQQRENTLNSASENAFVGKNINIKGT